MFPLIPELRAILEQQLERTLRLERVTGQIIAWLFHRNGTPIKSFRRAWLTACKDAGVPGRIPHDFRRTAVRNLERAGVPRSTAMALVGHKTEAIYRRYAIADEAMLREGASKLAALHAAEPRAARRMAAQGGSASENWHRTDTIGGVRREKRDGEENTNACISSRSNGGQGQNRTADTGIFSPVLYRLSYLPNPEVRAKSRGPSLGSPASPGEFLGGFL